MWDVLTYKMVLVFVCWTVILAGGVLLGSLRRYASFYAWVSVQAASMVVSVISGSAWGLDDPRYVKLYAVLWAASAAATAFLLCWFIALPQGSRKYRAFVPIPLFLVAATVLEAGIASEGHLLWRFVRSSSFFLLLTALLAIYRCFKPVRFRIGRNMGTVLVALSIRIFLDGIDATLFMHFEWAYGVYRSFSDLLGVIISGTMAWAMLVYDPPRWEPMLENGQASATES